MFPDYRIFEASRLQEMVTRMIDQVLIPISIIASFSLFVAVIVIANMMYISTLDRKREFAIMKAIGARNWSVLKNIAIENISVGVTGGFTSLLVLYLASLLMSMFLGLGKYNDKCYIHGGINRIVCIDICVCIYYTCI